MLLRWLAYVLCATLESGFLYAGVALQREYRRIQIGFIGPREWPDVLQRAQICIVASVGSSVRELRGLGFFVVEGQGMALIQQA